ncbi:MAG TPA: HYR domain-containing protein [Acidimicrobiales bacterium]|nr:HYR domain-containing protein [Acidimicrobiales bacterium]
MQRLITLATVMAALALSGAGSLGVAPALAGDTFTIVDTLGAAAPTTTFPLGPADGWTIGTSQFVGPEFTLTQRTVISEIGGFIAGGVFSPPGQARLLVEIRPSVNGNPDPSSVLGTFALSTDNTPFTTSYESVSPNFALGAGSYFALFTQPAESPGSYFLLAHAGGYTAGVPALGALCGGTPCSMQGTPAAVRILGRLDRDTTPPQLAAPGDIEVDAVSPAGARVTFDATATDDTDPNPAVSCDPASGSTFPVGTTTVSCAATDSSGNTSRAGFRVHVKGPSEQLEQLLVAVAHVGPGLSLANKVRQAQTYAGRNDLPAGCATLNAFSNEVRAQSGKSLRTADAVALISTAARIASALGC